MVFALVNFLRAASVLVFALGCAAILLRAQTATSVWDGIYSDAQATRGEAAYSKDCASCHGAKLQGRSQAPPLSGAEFTMNWNGASVAELFDKMQSSMPADQPGRLSPLQNAEILAYLLKANQFPAGPRELEGDSAKLRPVRFEAAKPKL